MAYRRPAAYPMPGVSPPRTTDGRAHASLLTSSIGLILALTACLLGATAYIAGFGSLLLGLLLGIPAMALGPVGYFLGRSSLGRIDASQGAVGGRGTATSGWAIGVITTVVASTVTLIALVLFLVANFGEPPV